MATSTSVLLAERSPGSLLPVLHLLGAAKRRHFAATRVHGLDAGVAELASGHFDVLLTDVPTSADNEDRLRQIGQCHPETAVVALADSGEAEAVGRLLGSAVDAYLLQDEASGPLLEHCLTQTIEHRCRRVAQTGQNWHGTLTLCEMACLCEVVWLLHRPGEHALADDLRRVATLLPAGLPDAEAACVRIRLGADTHSSPADPPACDWLDFPICSADRAVGKIEIGYPVTPGGGRLLAGARQLLAAVAEQLGQASERERSEALRSALYGISEAVHTGRDLTDLYVTIHQTIAGFMPAGNLSLALLDEAGDEVSFVYWKDERRPETPPPRRHARGKTDYVLRTGTALLADRRRLADLEAEGQLELGSPAPASCVAVPLHDGERLLGVLSVRSYDPDVAYTDRDREMLEFVSRQVTLAIQRRRDHLALAEGARRYGLLTEHASDMIYRFRLHPRPHCEYISPSALKILGYTPEEHYADPGLSLRLAHPDDRHLLGGAAGRPADPSDPLVMRWLHKNGSVVWLEMRVTPVLDESSRVVAVDGIAHDVTRLKAMEEELRRANQELQALIEASPLPIVSIDVGNRVIGWNSEAERVFGWTAAEVLGQVLPTIPPEAATDAAAVWRRVTEGDTFVSVETVRMRKNGSRLNVSIAYGPMHDAAGRISGFMAILKDITDAKRAEEALRQSEARYRELADLLPQTVFETDEYGLLTFANASARAAFGFADDEPTLGLPLVDMLIPEDRERGVDHMSHVLGGETLGVVEYTGLRRDGSSFPIVSHAAPIVRDGKLSGLRGVVFDMTERVRSEQALRESEAKLRALFNNASDAIFVQPADAAECGRPFLEVNDAACAWLGYSRSELLGMTAAEVGMCACGDWGGCGAPGEPTRDHVDSETSLIASDGTLIPVEVKSHLFTLNGQHVVLGIARDARERARARQIEAQYVRELTLLSETAMGFVQLPLDQDIDSYIAEKMRELAGDGVVVVATGDGTTAGFRVGAVAVPKGQVCPERSEFQAAVQALTAGEGVLASAAKGGMVQLSAEPSVTQTLGRVLPTAWRDLVESGEVYVQRFVHQGEALGLALILMRGKVGANVDVLTTFANQASVALERRYVERALQETHAQNEQLLASITAVLIGIDADVRITHWNQAAEAITGLQAATVMGLPLSECRADWDWEGVRLGIDECLVTRRTVRARDVHYVRPDGRAGILSLTVSPSAKQPGVAPGALILATEVTELRIVESQLNQEQKLRSIGQLAAGIAHEINTPTQYVSDNLHFLGESCHQVVDLLRLYGQLLEQSRAAETDGLRARISRQVEQMDLEYLLEEMPVAVSQSIEGTGHVAKIVLAMKEFSHPGRSEAAAVDLNRTIDSTITVSRSEWRYVADMVTDLDASLPPVPCLPGEISQVVLNVIVNAAHAIADVVGDGSHGKGTITVTTRPVDGWAEIRIGDTGTGIPEAIRDRVFDPFFTTKDVGRGTGQGLALAHNVVVSKHRGTITFETEVGKGTTFVIRLPLAPEGQSVSTPV